MTNLFKNKQVAMDMVHLIGISKEENLNKEILKEHYTKSAVTVKELERAISILKALHLKQNSEESSDYTEILVPTSKLYPIIFKVGSSESIVAIAPRGPVGQEWHGVDEVNDDIKPSSSENV